MLIDIIFRISYTKVERMLARRNYRERVLDPAEQHSDSETENEEGTIQRFKEKYTSLSN